jgi:hypothetical protein
MLEKYISGTIWYRETIDAISLYLWIDNITIDKTKSIDDIAKNIWESTF